MQLPKCRLTCQPTPKQDSSESASLVVCPSWIRCYSPTQYERPFGLWMGDTVGAVTPHSYHTCQQEETRQMEQTKVDQACTVRASTRCLQVSRVCPRCCIHCTGRFTLVGPTQRQKCTSRSAPAGRYTGLRSGKKMANLHKATLQISRHSHQGRRGCRGFRAPQWRASATGQARCLGGTRPWHCHAACQAFHAAQNAGRAYQENMPGVALAGSMPRCTSLYRTASK